MDLFSDFERLLEESFKQDTFREGEILSGRVISISKDFVLVDIGAKSEGQVPVEEFRSFDGTISVNPGDRVDVLLESQEDEDGLVVLSKEKADKMKIWDDISDACERDELVEGIITARVKGGLQVDIGVKAFLPGSQVDIRPVRNLDKYIGEKHSFKVIKFNKKRGNIVLSRRALLEKEREQLKKKTLENLEEAKEVIGTIKNITEYGAFVDLGGIDGLLHITDMSWGRVNHPSELYHVGDEIKVKVLKFNSDTERVSLGVKQITEDPWIHADRRYPNGHRVFGKVVSLTDYGAFVELEEGIEGLIHISEMSWTKRVKHPSKVVSIGDEIETIVLDVDIKGKRISLGMKQLEPNPWTLLQEKYPVASTIRGRIRNITEFGIFVGIEEGIDGLVHISDLSWTYRIKHPSELFKKSDEVEAVVLNIDVENERFSLGIKQLFPDPWTFIPRHYPAGREANGKVLRATESGYLVELEPGVESVIPPNEVPESKTPKVGDSVTVQVTFMDPHEHRLGLSMKTMSEGDVDDPRRYMAGNASTALGDLLKEKLAMDAAVSGDEIGEAAAEVVEAAATAGSPSDTDQAEENLAGDEE